LIIVLAEQPQNEAGKLEFLRSIWYYIGKEAQRRSGAKIYKVIWEISD
jgi:hypothetical protein